MTMEVGAAPGGRMVRPYTITGGRTGSGLPPIALEALVAATPAGLRMKGEFRWEAAQILALSRRETAIVELAATMEVPVGVVRVLAADLEEQGAVTITEPPVMDDAGDGSYADLLRRVLDGINAL